MDFTICANNGTHAERKFSDIEGVAPMPSEPVNSGEHAVIDGVSRTSDGYLFITVNDLQSYRRDPETNWVHLSSQSAAVLYEEEEGWQEFAPGSSATGRFKASEPNLSNKLDPFKP